MNKAAIEFTVERLLAIHADEQLRRNFSLSLWSNGLGTHDLAQPEDPMCGFSGCVVGWAIHQQWYARWGLHLAFQRDGSVRVGNVAQTIHPIVLESSAPRFSTYAHVRQGMMTESSIEAVAELLGLGMGTFSKVIYEEAYENEEATPLLVAERLQEILEVGEDAFMDLQVEREERWAENAGENAG